MSRFSTKHQQTVTENFLGSDGVLKNTASDVAHCTKSFKKCPNMWLIRIITGCFSYVTINQYGIKFFLGGEGGGEGSWQWVRDVWDSVSLKLHIPLSKKRLSKLFKTENKKWERGRPKVNIAAISKCHYPNSWHSKENFNRKKNHILSSPWNPQTQLLFWSPDNRIDSVPGTSPAAISPVNWINVFGTFSRW